MGVGAGLYMCDVVKKFTFAISYPDEFLYFSALDKAGFPSAVQHTLNITYCIISYHVLRA